MYYFTKWDVLIVDDDPDVLALSRLAMRNMGIYGLPLRMHVAQSKAEAIEVLHSHPDLANNLALAFIDVIMETNTAGLELCDYIRGELGNDIVQIFVRTGQAGLASDKAVTDHYEINGYFSKMEATEEKLYSLVKSGVRQFLSSYMARIYMAGFNEVLRAPYWRQQIQQLVVNFIESISNETTTPLYIAFDGNVLAQKDVDVEQLAMWRQQLYFALFENHRFDRRENDDFQANRSIDRSASIRFSLDGNAYVRDDTNFWGIQIVERPTNVEVLLLCQTTFAPSDDIVVMTHGFLQGLAALWKQGE